MKQNVMQQEGFYETIEITNKDNMAVRFLYNTVPGRLLLGLLIKTPVSKLAGSVLGSRASRVLIRGFVKRNNIKMEEFKDVRYRSFNDFFTREIDMQRRPFPNNEQDLAAPCDGKLSAYPIAEDSVFHIKNSTYSVSDLLQDENLAAEYLGGTCLIIRLTPDDYHRYSYIDDGEVLQQKKIRGKLHSVRPISQHKVNVFTQNSREFALMQTKNFGKVVQMEVGALFVGRITNNSNVSEIRRGVEKGMFQFGGSTVIMLFQPGSVKLDEAIRENTLRDKETIVRMGHKIGERKGMIIRHGAIER